MASTEKCLEVREPQSSILRYPPVVRRSHQQADVVVVEGVGGGKRKHSLLVGAFTLSYRC